MQKTVLITGSSRGIGFAIAREFATDKNYNIVINCSKDVENLKLANDELLKINKNVLAIKCDVSNYDEVDKMFTQIENKFGPVDVLINNAGISKLELFNLQKIDEINNMVSVNLMSTINCSKRAIDFMISKKSGNIINISSIWGEVGSSMEVIYSTTKAGIIGFTKALAKENAPSNILVNAISAGVIDTQMNSFLNEEEKEMLKDSIPIGRFGTPKEIANLCKFLASDKNTYITGQTIRIDGGLL